MPFKIVRNNITNIDVCAIVSSINPNLAIKENIQIGEVQLISSFNPDSILEFQTASPIWKTGLNNERDNLYSCYMNSLQLALSLNLESIAFPLIATGDFGFPERIALDIATKAISDFLQDNELMIYLSVFKNPSFILSKESYLDIQDNISKHMFLANISEETIKPKNREEIIPSLQYRKAKSYIVTNRFENIDGTFQETLFKIIDKKELTDPYVYKKANLDRRLFAKIRKDKIYHPSKITAVSLCIALELNLDETNELLKRAGYTLSHSIIFDLIIEIFIKRKEFNIYKINEALLDNDQPLLGS